jgi:hypothetical protein
VLVGRARQVTASLTAQASRHGLSESQRVGVEACVLYLIGDRLDVTVGHGGIVGGISAALGCEGRMYTPQPPPRACCASDPMRFATG